MSLTISDAMKIDLLKSLELIAGYSGLKNKISKVGILDFEFTQKGSHHCVEDQFIADEFILTSFLCAKNNETLILQAIKKLIQFKSSGLVIRNVFSFKITKEIIQYANMNNFPIFILTDNSIFFEDIIIGVTNALNLESELELKEKKINTILHENIDKDTIKKLCLELNYYFKKCFIAIYFNRKDTIDSFNTFNLLEIIKGKTIDIYSSIIKHKNGFFYIATFDSTESLDLNNIADYFISKLNINLKDYYIGISNPQFHLTEFKKGLLESIYASQFNKISESDKNHYSDIGVYKFILPFIDEVWVNDFYSNIINPLIEYDITYNSELLDTAIKYIENNGNIKDTSAELFQHENTVRYRINKISELINIKTNNKNFYEQLSIAVKIYKVIPHNQG